MVDLLPIYVVGGSMGAVLGLLPFAWQNIKNPEARFYTWARLRRYVIVRVHHADGYEKLYYGHLGTEGLIIEDKNGKKLAIDPRNITHAKNSRSNGLEYVDVGSNTLWPVGAHEGIRISIIEEYIEDPENGCPFLKSLDLLTRHTLLQSKAADLTKKIIPLLNIDPASITIDTEGKDMNDLAVQEDLKKKYEVALNTRVESEINKVVTEIDKVHDALEGRAVFTQPFSWSDTCFAINSQLQPENVSRLDTILQNLATDPDKQDEKKWKNLYMGLLVFGVVVVGIIAAYKLIIG